MSEETAVLSNSPTNPSPSGRGNNENAGGGIGSNSSSNSINNTSGSGVMQAQDYSLEKNSNMTGSHAIGVPITNGIINDSSKNKSVAHGFRMQIQQHNNTNNPTSAGSRTIRKRKRDNEASSALSSSSSSSSDEDEETKQATTAPSSSSVSSMKQQHQNAQSTQQQQQQRRQQSPAVKKSEKIKEGINTKDIPTASSASMAENDPPRSKTQQQQQQNHQPQHHQSPPQQQQQQQQQQPEGWRVKLYRLNADGTWDDCGTGRILCMYKQPSKNSQLTGDAWIYQELGEPTLCMHSEVSGNAAPRILLRTRILLRDAYQRQGDNIITWCEPYLEEGNPTQGVDLALSFQDNAGCLDIWRQITQVQSRAADIYRHNGSTADNRGGSPGGYGTSAAGAGVPVGDNNGNTSQSSNNDSASHTGAIGVGGGGANSSSSNNNNAGTERNNAAAGHGGGEGGGSVSDMAQAVAAAHHANLQRQQQQEMWVNVASEATQHRAEHQNHVVEHHHHHHHHQERHFEDTMGGMTGAYHDSNGTVQANNNNSLAIPQLPNPPTLANLEEVSDTIAAVQHIQQRESFALYISQNECLYLKSLLSLFPSAEAHGDYSSLATLAACVKTILLLNDPSIIELIVQDEHIFEEVCATLEYDPDLRDKANHRWFLRERAKFRTVVWMDDEELVSAIHRAFRVNYLRDTLLRPTMDENSLSTLTSLQTFTHGDVVKMVTMSQNCVQNKLGPLKDSYLVRVLRLLGNELHALSKTEWDEIETLPPNVPIQALLRQREDDPYQRENVPSAMAAAAKERYPQSPNRNSTIWKQHLSPQDNSLTSRRIRRRGCLSFLRELFNMVRISMQQIDKDDFFATLVPLEFDLDENNKPQQRSANKNDENIAVGGTSHDGNDGIGGNIGQGEQGSTSSNMQNQLNNDNDTINNERRRELDDTNLNRDKLGSSNLLSLMAMVLSDPNTDVTEKGSVLEMVSGIAMHDPSLVRRHCLDYYNIWKKDLISTSDSSSESELKGPGRPNANPKKQIIFQCPPDDLLASLLFLLAIETDAGVLLQVSEVMRVILDTDMMGEHGPMGAGFADEAEGIPPGQHHAPHEHHNTSSGSGASTTEQNQFLSMFYDHYVQWLAAPFQFTIFHPVRRIPNSHLRSTSRSPVVEEMLNQFQKETPIISPILNKVPPCAIRSSFAVELLGFCVRSHMYRMKCFLLRSRVLWHVLRLLKPTSGTRVLSGYRCLKLAALRFLRVILSVKDEFYHRHIIQQNLFAPVFEAFRANPVGDNLVSSAIIEMCDHIQTENIKSLIEHIVTKHLSAPPPNNGTEGTSLEIASSPYVSTLTTLRQAYERNLKAANNNNNSNKAEGSTTAAAPATSATITSSATSSEGGGVLENGTTHSRYFSVTSAVVPSNRVAMSEKAIEDQRKFREADQEESYFEADDDDEDNVHHHHHNQLRHTAATTNATSVGTPTTTSTTTVVPPAVDEVAAQEGDNTDLHRTPRMFSLTQAPLLKNNSNRISNNNIEESTTTITTTTSQEESHNDQSSNK